MGDISCHNVLGIWYQMRIIHFYRVMLCWCWGYDSLFFSLLKSPNVVWRLLESSGVLLLSSYVSSLYDAIDDTSFAISPTVTLLCLRVGCSIKGMLTVGWV